MISLQVNYSSSPEKILFLNDSSSEFPRFLRLKPGGLLKPREVLELKVIVSVVVFIDMLYIPVFNNRTFALF